MNEQHKRLPPYVSYRTFINFVNRLQQENMPSRIDRSYWGDMFSGSTGTQLVAALRFLNLIDDNSRPTPLLRSLATSRGEQKTTILRQITAEAYGFILQSPLLEPNSATFSQLEEVFKATFQLADDVRRKCIKFFIALAGEAGIPLSPFILKKTRASRAATGTKISAKKPVARTKQNTEIPIASIEIPDRTNWNKMLLEKFPTFDPSWSDEIKLKWFSAFDELLKRSFLEGKKSE